MTYLMLSFSPASFSLPPALRHTSLPALLQLPLLPLTPQWIKAALLRLGTPQGPASPGSLLEPHSPQTCSLFSRHIFGKSTLQSQWGQSRFHPVTLGFARQHGRCSLGCDHGESPWAASLGKLQAREQWVPLRCLEHLRRTAMGKTRNILW